MALFPAEFSTRVSKYINNLDKVMKNRIKEKIEKLEENPFPQEVERVEDYKDEKVFRVRVGNQRILYIVRYSPNKLIITKVDKRPRIYDR
ncbi:type II toxin-antitoxin system RelE/ParE family toxin [Candidatus Woesearchaeota archaeon]|nr:type II toxin-antitoxin system RelE/ParE family toxin [Candidatus Woesearchaeota archaeon]